MTRSTPIIIDTDPGIDDAMAILYALADPAVDLIGLTTIFGNVPEATATRNTLALLELAGADIPVAAGAAMPLVQTPHPHPDFVHGVEGFGDALLDPPMRRPDARPAYQFIIDAVTDRPGEITLVPVGPLTNLALALQAAPEIAQQVARVVIMGGAVRHKGNVNAYAEANIWQDPHAAAAVFAAEWPMTLVGLDVTERVICTAADLAPMMETSPRCGAFLTKAAEFYFGFHRETEGIDGCHLHDPSAIIAALDPAPFEQISAPLSVTLEGAEAGMTREATRGPPIDLCLGVDAERVLGRFRRQLASGRLP